MTDTLTPNLGLVNQTEGGNDNTWGIKVDDNFEQIDDVLGDTTTIATTGGTTVLTDEQELVMAIAVSGTLVSNATVEFSGRGGEWIVANDTDGDFTLTVKVTGETGVQVAQGTATTVWCDGTDIRLGVPTAEVAADATPQLGGDLDANGFDIGFDDGTGITDENGNEQVLFHTTASAVNQVGVTNAATGDAPQIAAEGDDTDIDLEVAGKGTGGVVASFKQGTGLGLKDSDSSHDLKIKTSSDLTADRTLDLVTGDADRSVTLAGDLSVGSGGATISGTHSGTSSGTNTGDEASASDSAEGIIEIADASEMEAATATNRAVPPGRMHRHPGVVKAGGNFNGQGTPVFRSGDYGMGAITDNGTGNYTLALDTAFANTNYWLNQWARSSTSRGIALFADSGGSKTTSSIRVDTDLFDTDDAPTDSPEVGVNFWGDYA